MVGGVTWAGTWFFAAAHRSWWGWVPGAVMFVGGGLLFWWGFKSPDPKRLALAWLDDSLHEAQVIQNHSPADFEVRWRQWSRDTYSVLLRWLGEDAANRFRPPVAPPPASGF